MISQIKNKHFLFINEKKFVYGFWLVILRSKNNKFYNKKLKQKSYFYNWLAKEIISKATLTTQTDIIINKISKFELFKKVDIMIKIIIKIMKYKIWAKKYMPKVKNLT